MLCATEALISDVNKRVHLTPFLLDVKWYIANDISVCI